MTPAAAVQAAASAAASAPASASASASAPAGWSFTVDDAPHVVDRIGADLARVVDTVRAADPGLRSLVLTGGFARGEGTMLHGRPQNDYDFVALRGLRPSQAPYPELAEKLEGELGLHIDLAPVAAARLPFVHRSIFWYETALRGRVLWGEDLLGRIPVRSADALDREEGLRLLVNRAAGLLLVTSSRDAHARRIQAAKGLLAALDAQLLAVGAFAPSQRERWQSLERLRDEGREPAVLRLLRPWLEWAMAFKLDPARAPVRDAGEAWRAARHAILRVVPAALAHAGLRDLDAYARRDGWLDRAVFARRAKAVPGARRLARHPTARLRVGTLRLLADAADGKLHADSVRRHLGPLLRQPAREPVHAVHLLDGLRRATLQ